MWILAIQKPSSTGRQPSRALIEDETNPLLADFEVLDFHLYYLRTGNEVVPAASTFRAFEHLYDAFLAEGFLEVIPFLEA